jgi:hypothetical protein
VDEFQPTTNSLTKLGDSLNLKQLDDSRRKVEGLGRIHISEIIERRTPFIGGWGFSGFAAGLANI